MFDALTDKLQAAFAGLRGRGKLTESDIDKAMRAIRLSLLEADVSLPVVKRLTGAIAERARGAEVMESLTPDQQVVKIVSDELTALMGESNVALPLASKPPTIVLMAGLQGSGKTTCCAKLARHFVSQGRAPMLVAADVHRPAAAEQLAVLGDQIGVPVHREDGRDAVAIARNGVDAARRAGRDLVIVDTAGRLSIDAGMMDELVRIREAIQPTSVVLV
ncbi:MAG: signal recognition particle receptor subunit alpha, partial [Thermoleophilia bacterium]|nr:signal recognition particle receptor subunit alpha [Thermoleophilia bacterium]